MLNETTKQIKRDYRYLQRKNTKKRDLFKNFKLQLKKSMKTHAITMSLTHLINPRISFILKF